MIKNRLRIAFCPQTKTGPRPILGAPDQSRPQGIAFDVADDGEKIVVLLDRKRLETSLPNMAARPVLAMVTAHMRRHQPLHPMAEVAVPEGP